jgi:hypothetical protein
MWPFRNQSGDVKAWHCQALQKLIDLGYLKYVPDRDQQAVKEEILTSMKRGVIGSAWDSTEVAHDRRSYPVDLEDLAHGGIGKHLTLMKDVFTAEGCCFNSLVDDYRKSDGGVHYEVLVNGERFMISWDDADDDNLRRIALQTLLTIGNRLLQEAESKEKLVGISLGDTGRTMFLTQDMLSYLYSLQGIEFRWFTSNDLFAC